MLRNDVYVVKWLDTSHFYINWNLFEINWPFLDLHAEYKINIPTIWDRWHMTDTNKHKLSINFKNLSIDNLILCEFFI